MTRLALPNSSINFHGPRPALYNFNGVTKLVSLCLEISPTYYP